MNISTKSSAKIKNYLDFLWAMTEKEIKARYKRVFFGFLWVIINPLFQMVVIGIIFSLFIKIPNYFLFLFSGLLPWQFFSLSLNKTTPSIVFERALLQKAKFSIEAIPTSIIMANFINLLISLTLLVLFLLIFNAIYWPGILLIFPALLWLLVFTVGLSLFTSSLNVRFRDISFFTQTILILWFYATPIIYNLGLIPERYHIYFSFNPLTSIFELLHISLTGQGTIKWEILVINIVVTILIIIISIVTFKKEHKYFVDWL